MKGINKMNDNTEQAGKIMWNGLNFQTIKKSYARGSLIK